jgi:hypothetical protein
MRLRKRTPARGLEFEAFGVPMELVTDDADAEAQALEILPPGWKRCPPNKEATSFVLRRDGDDRYEVTVGGTTFTDNGSFEVALGVLDSQIRLHVAAHATDRTFVHAGVVVLGGRALVLPGDSFSGKSTLVEALVEHGAGYYSDEYAVLDQRGKVHPYRRPLRTRTPTAAVEQAVGGLRGDATGAEIGLVAITRYRPDADWRPERLARGHGITLVLPNVVAAHLRAKQSLQTVTRALRGATVLRSDRGEAGPVAAALIDVLESG